MILPYGKSRICFLIDVSYSSKGCVIKIEFPYAQYFTQFYVIADPIIPRHSFIFLINNDRPSLVTRPPRNIPSPVCCSQVIRMLFVIVLEFFVCWAPLHVINTWYLFAPDFVYSTVGSTGISLVQLLAYVSSCCNPITYCFMNRKFRQAFLGLFDCHRCWR